MSDIYNVMYLNEHLYSFDTEEEAIEYAKKELLDEDFYDGDSLYITKDIKVLTKGKSPIKVKTVKG